jgi:uncharacterized Zn finger protein
MRPPRSTLTELHCGNCGQSIGFVVKQVRHSMPDWFLRCTHCGLVEMQAHNLDDD